MDIKAWSYDRITDQNKARDELKKHLLELDLKAKDDLLTDYDCAKREEWLDYLDRIHREDLKQKSRLKWAIKGDENTRFFHSILKINYCNSNIKGIMVNGIWQEDPRRLKRLPMITSLPEFLECIKYFKSIGRLANGCNSSFIVIILKRNDPLGVGDYRPISLIGYVYKVIYKILSNRLARVIASVIIPNQTAFISGRQILDVILIANEIIIRASIEDTKLILFKVNFENAFNSVNWSFFLDIVRQIGSNPKWRSWIFLCLSSASISVLINGSPSKSLVKCYKSFKHVSKILDSALSKAREKSVRSASQADTRPAEGEKDTNQETISQLFQRRAEKNAKYNLNKNKS
nr:transposon TX1 uncharacterized [Tanacetum cinerariifolium]